MRVYILSAGKGKCLGEPTSEPPKGFVQLEKCPLLSYQSCALRVAGIPRKNIPMIAFYQSSAMQGDWLEIDTPRDKDLYEGMHAADKLPLFSELTSHEPAIF